jgi:hypothetical protein
MSSEQLVIMKLLNAFEIEGMSGEDLDPKALSHSGGPSGK